MSYKAHVSAHSNITETFYVRSAKWQSLFSYALSSPLSLASTIFMCNNKHAKTISEGVQDIQDYLANQETCYLSLLHEAVDGSDELVVNLSEGTFVSDGKALATLVHRFKEVIDLLEPFVP